MGLVSFNFNRELEGPQEAKKDGLCWYLAFLSLLILSNSARIPNTVSAHHRAPEASLKVGVAKGIGDSSGRTQILIPCFLRNHSLVKSSTQLG